MSERSLLIRCASRRPEDQEEIERWLAGRVRTLASCDALLYHLAPPRNGAASDGRGEAWVVELGAPEQTAKPGAVSTLLAEMRMLGLDPTVFRGAGD